MASINMDVGINVNYESRVLSDRMLKIFVRLGRKAQCAFEPQNCTLKMRVMNLSSSRKPAGFQHFPTELMRLLCAACASFFSVGKIAAVGVEETPHARRSALPQIESFALRANDPQEKWCNIHERIYISKATQKFTVFHRVKDLKSKASRKHKQCTNLEFSDQDEHTNCTMEI